MNTTPLLNWHGRVVRIDNHGCGRIGLQNDAMAFWQSRMTTAGNRAELPQLADIPAIAQEVRRVFHS